MATLPIHLEVEDVAVGPVLIALRKMPGIIKLHLALLDEPKSGRQDREHSGRAGGQIGAQPAKPGANAERIVALLMQNNGGPLKITEIMHAIGSTKSSAYTAMYTLKKKKVVQTPHVGQYELTDKAKRELLPDQAPKLLTGPKTNGAKPTKKAAKVALHKGPGGRPSPGSGWKLLRAALESGIMRRADLITTLAANGMSEKSVSGIVDRANRNKLIKGDGAGSWELTAKGRSQQPTAEAAGA